MTPELRGQLRLSLLRQADAASSRGLSLEVFVVGAKIIGIPCTPGEVEKEIEYLLDKRMLEKLRPPVSPELWRACIRAEGRDWLAQEGY